MIGTGGPTSETISSDIKIQDICQDIDRNINDIVQNLMCYKYHGYWSNNFETR